MPATRYKIWQTGGPVGEGATQSIYVGTHGIAKTFTDRNPYIVANELICSRLAQAILLPVPPGFVIDREGVPYFASMNFNLAGEDLPPVQGANVVRDQPRIAWGIVLFDVWVLNRDRHNRNIAHDTNQNWVQIFDHSHAFLWDNQEVNTHLEANVGNLGIGAVGQHCLAGHLENTEHVQEWIHRIGAVPSFYINELVESAVEVGLPHEAWEHCAQFLLGRRDNLLNLVKGEPAHFPSIDREALAAL